MNLDKFCVLLFVVFAPLTGISQGEASYVRVIFKAPSGSSIDGIKFNITAYAAGQIDEAIETKPWFIKGSEALVLFEKRTLDRTIYFRVVVSSDDWRVVEPEMKYYKHDYDPTYSVPNTRLPFECRLKQVPKESNEVVRLRKLLAEAQETAEATKKNLEAANSREAKNVLEIGRMRTVIDSLEIAIAETSKKLKLQERTEYYASIASGLSEFKERLLNLSQVLKPSTVKDAFLYDSTRNTMTKASQLYGVARDELAITRQSNVARVRSYWPDNGRNPSIADELDSLYALALISINREILVEQVNDRIYRNINASGTGRIPRVVAQKKSVKIMRNVKPKLDQLIARFVNESDRILATLGEI